VRPASIPQRRLNLSQWLVASDVDSVRDWLDELEKRAARNALIERDLNRLGNVVKELQGGKVSWRIPRARAVRAIADWLALGTTDADPLLAQLARIDQAFSTLQLNRDDMKALTGKTGAKHLREHTLAARLSLRAGALGCARTERPDSPTVEAKRRLFRKATD
jgi:hypothetical protein